MRRKFLIGIGILLLLGVCAVMFAPWKSWVEQGLKASLVQEGIKDVDFTLDTLAIDGIVLKNISFGELFTLNEMTVSYNVRELLKGQLKELKAGDLTLKLQDKEIKAKDVVLMFPRPEAAGTWKGTWSVASIEISNLTYPLPPLAGKGDFTAAAKSLHVEGALQSADNMHHAIFSVDTNPSEPENAKVLVKEAGLPWNGGMIATKDAVVRFSGKERFSGVLDIKNIELDNLLKSLTGDRATATGAVSGKVPLVIDDTGNPVITGAVLSTAENGRITLAADAIPGDNEQLDILRGVLANFQYKTLSMGVESDKQKKLSAKLTLEGNNPDMYGGRPVKLNVHLTGDVLNLLQQSVPTLTDPKQLLKQGNYAEP